MATGPQNTRRELELVLKVVPDTAAGQRSMDQLAASAEKVEKATSKAEKAARSATAAATGQTPAGAVAALGGRSPTAVSAEFAAAVAAQRSRDAQTKAEADAAAARKKAADAATAAQKEKAAQAVIRQRLAEGVVSAIDPDTGKRVFSYGGPRTAGQAAADLFLGARPVNPTTGALGERAGGLLGQFGISPGMAKGLGVAALAYQAVKTSKAAADAYQDELLTNDQRARVVFRSLPFGETALSYADTFTGRARNLARVQESHAVETAKLSGRLELAGKKDASDREVAAAAGIARAYDRSAPVLMPTGIDRSTAAGERQYRLEQQLLTVRQRTSAAEREAAAAAEEQAAAKARSLDYAKKARDLEVRHGRTERDLQEQEQGADKRTRPYLAVSVGAYVTARALDLGGPDRQDVLNQRERMYEEQRANRQLREQAARDEADAAKRGARARAEVQAAQADVYRARAGDLESRAAAGMATAERLGGMDRSRRALGVQALQYIANVAGGDLDRVPQELADLAATVAPRKVQDWRRRTGAASPDFAAIAAISPEDANNFRGLQGQADELRNQAEKLQFDAERTLTRSVETITRRFGEALDKLGESLLAEVERRARNGQLQSRTPGR